MSPARLLIFPAALLSCSGCFYAVTLPGNTPDASCGTDAGPGNTTLEGPGSFSVLSSTQTKQQIVFTDGGLGGTYLTFNLSNRALGCGETPDSGTQYPALFAYLWGEQPGTYLVRPDGGPEMLLALKTPFFNGGQPALATSGGFELTDVAACSISGYLDAGFELPDGGATWIRGPVTASYCSVR